MTLAEELREHFESFGDTETGAEWHPEICDRAADEIERLQRAIDAVLLNRDQTSGLAAFSPSLDGALRQLREVRGCTSTGSAIEANYQAYRNWKYVADVLFDASNDLVTFLRKTVGPNGIQLKASDEVFGHALAQRLEALEAAIAKHPMMK